MGHQQQDLQQDRGHPWAITWKSLKYWSFTKTSFSTHSHHMQHAIFRHITHHQLTIQRARLDTLPLVSTI